MALAWIATALFVMMLGGCGKQPDNAGITQSPPAGQTKTPEPPPPPKPVTYAYSDWSAWDMDCAQQAKDNTLPCAAVRKRVCRIEGSDEGVSCDHCGGVCREEVADATGSPLHIYSKWGDWSGNCEKCDPQSKPCKVTRRRICLDRVAARQTDCEFCGGACSEDEDRVTGCDAECKWTRVESYSDSACTQRVSDDIFAGQWGPQTNTPFNSGCPTTGFSECKNFGRNYYKWEACTPGCNAPIRK